MDWLYTVFHMDQYLDHMCSVFMTVHAATVSEWKKMVIYYNYNYCYCY